MKTFNKYVFKDLKTLFPKLLAIILIVAIGVGFTLGLMTSAPNMHYSVEKFYEETNAADVIMQGSLFNEEFVKEVDNNPLIEDTFAYFAFDEEVGFQNGNHLARINVLNFQDEISVNKLTLIEGRLPNPNSEIIEVVIERKQPFLIDVPLGYETTFMDKTIRVVGIVHHPWYFAFVEEISYAKQQPIEIIVYADLSLLDDIMYTHIAIKLVNSNKYHLFSDKYKNFLFEQIELLKNDYPNFYYLSLDMNQSYAKYASDVSIIKTIAIIFPLFFLLVAILVTMASMTRIVEDQRNQIGTLRSLGYSNSKIMIKYIFYALISSIIGALFGIALGVYFIPRIIYDVYTTIYNLPPFSIRYYLDYTSIISLVMIVAVVIITITSTYSHLREKPTELLRAKSPKPGQKILLERIPFVWKRLKFKYKSTFRNIFRHKRNLFLTLIGISGSTALLLAGFAIKDSVEIAGKYQYEEMLQYNLEINVNELVEINEINNYQKINVFSTSAQFSDRDFISIVSFEDSNDVNQFIYFKNEGKERFNFTSNSVVVTKQFAIRYELDIGSKIRLKVLNQEIEIIITNIQEYYFGNQIYIAKELLEPKIALLYNKIYVKISDLDLKTKEDIKKVLSDNPSITKVMFEDDLKYAYEQTANSMNGIIIILVVFSCALAIVINYNLILINIHTRTKEIATLKVLGYQEIEVSGYVFRETVIISSVAILLGLVFGKMLHYFIISQIDVDGIILANQITWLSYLLTIILSFIFIAMVFVMSIPQTKRINMIEALKSYE